MVEALGVIAILIIIGLAGSFIYYRFQDSFSPKPSIYLVPNKKQFILSQGNYRVLFDALTFIPAGDAYFNVDGLSIAKYSEMSTNSVNFFALDRDGVCVALVPTSLKGYESIALHSPGTAKPQQFRIIDFEKKQHDILVKHAK